MNTDHFEVDVRANCLVINCREHFSPTHSDELIQLLESLDASFDTHRPPPLLFMQLHEDGELHAGFLRKMAKVAVGMKKKGKKIFVVGGTKENVALLEQYGLDELLMPVDTVEHGLSAMGVRPQAKLSPPVRIDVEFLNPFVEGLQEMLRLQCQVDATMGKPFVKKQGEALAFETAATVVLQSRVLNGAIVLGMGEKTFAGLLGRQLRRDFSAGVDEKFRDGIAELLNMVFGFAKNTLNTRADYEIQMRIPQVLRDPARLADPAGGHLALVVPFETELGPLWLQTVTITDAASLDGYLAWLAGPATNH